MLDFVLYNYTQNPIFHYYILTFVVIIGLIFGSFVNVVGLRLLSGESIVLPPSKCPVCNTKLKWYDNIPVLAYLFLMGKCRYCKTPISWQYPLVEAVSAVVFLLIFLKFEFTFATLFLWYLAGASVVMCITDFREQIIFDAVSIPLIPMGLIYSFLNLPAKQTDTVEVFNTGIFINEVFLSALLGVALGFVIFECISLFSKIIIKQRAFGEGDTIIAMIFGAFLGWKAVVAIVIISFIVQAIATLPIMLIKILKTRDKIAITSFFTLFGAIFIPLLLNRFDIFYSTIGSLILIVGTLSIAIYSALTFLKRMKELNAYTLLPFGPALIVAGFLVLFFEDYFLSFFVI